MQMRYRSDIDGLRAVAVGAVVLYHAGFTAFSGGFVGVDVFFVISGYLIGQALFKDADAGRLSIARFYERRFRRILPALVVVILTTLAASLFILLPSEVRSLANSAIASAGFVANLYFWKTQTYFGGEPLTKPLLHMWSLAVEEQYYLFWPLFVLALYRFKLTRWRTPLIAAGIVLSLVSTELMLGYSPKTAFYMMPMRVWELLAGAIVAAGDLPAVRRRGLAEGLSALALALILAPILLYTDTVRFPGISAVPICLGTALLIHIGETIHSRTHRLLSLRPLLFVGLISYSLYLWHWPIFALHFLSVQRAATASESLVLILVSVAAGWLSWRFVERPFRTKHDPAGDARRPQAALLVSALALFGLAGTAYALSASNGLPQRLPPAARAVDEQRPERFRIEVGCMFLNNVDPDALSHCFAAARRDPREKIVLWGDSFARHHVPELALRAHREGKVLVSFIATGCLPTPGVDAAFGQGRLDWRCAEFSNRIARELRAMPHLTALIVAGRWSHLGGLRIPGEGSDPSARFLMDHGTDVRTLETSVRALSDALRRIAIDMDRRGVPTTFLTEPPHYLRMAKSCVARALWNRTPTHVCASDLAEQRAFRRPLARLFDAALRSSPRVTVYDALPSLCDPQCMPFRDGRLLTYDANHLTMAGSRVALHRFTLPELVQPKMRFPGPNIPADTQSSAGRGIAERPADR